MTVKQKQCLLAYLGYYVGEIDGDWGQLSKTATKAFQKDFGITADGVCGAETEKAMTHAVAYGMPVRKETDDFWKNVKYFTRDEFACQCGKCGGFPVEPDKELVLALDEFRRRLGVPVQIVTAGGSGVRCKQHNTAVGGAKNSQHLYGLAADLHSSKSPKEMYTLAESILGNSGGLGLYSWGIHFDKRKTKSRWNG